MLALELAAPVRASENAATLIPGRLRGAMARPERLCFGSIRTAQKSH